MQVLETCLYVDDLEAARTFYVDVLGFDVLSQVAERHLFLRAGAGVLLLFNPAVTEQEQVLPPHGAHGAQHIALRVEPDAIEPWTARLHAANVPIICDFAWPSGYRSIYFHDPAGNVVELAPAQIWGLETTRE